MDDGSKKNKLLLGKMAERKVVIMYKDVWKKFGAKIMIVVCSILLLGGVAIAAPRLRAAGEETIDLVDPALTKAEVQKTIPNLSDITYTEGDTEGRFPRTLKIGGETCSYQVDYTVAIRTTDSDVNNWSNATPDGMGVTIRINHVASSSRLTKDYILKYPIYRKQIDDGQLTFEPKNEAYRDGDEYRQSDFTTTQISQIESGNYLMLTDTDKDSRIGADKFNVYVDGTSLSGLGYSVLTESDSNPGGEFTFSGVYSGATPIYFHMDNYENASGNQNFRRTVGLKRHIKTYDITVKESASDSGTKITNWINRTVTQNPTVNVAGIGVNKYNVSYVPTQGDKKKIQIVANEDNCFGKVESPEYTQILPSYDFQLVKKTGSVIEGPEDFTILYETNNTFLLNDSNKNEFTVQRRLEGSDDYEDVSWDDITLGSGAVYDGLKKLDGATAGWVRQNITAQIDGQLVSGVLTFQVVRRLDGNDDLTNPGVNTGLIVEEPKGRNGETAPYIYNASKSYNLLPQIYFQSEDGKYLLEENKDYTVSYQLRKIGQSNFTDTKVCKDAGTVIMIVTGKGAYTGTLTGKYDGGDKLGKLAYRIAQQPIGSSEYAIRLDEERKSGNIYSYPMGTTTDKIIEDARRVTKDGQNPWDFPAALKKYTDYDVRFYQYPESGGEPTFIAEGTALLAGYKYQIEFEFKGNYTTPQDEKLTCDFQIIKYEWKDLLIEVNQSCEDGICVSSSAIKGHVYNGGEHRPKVTIRQKDGTELDPSMYGERDYANNINASDKAIVKIWLIGHDDLYEKSFEILPRTLTQSDIQFSTKDGFVNSADGWTHNYDGRGIIPTITELVITNPGDSGSSGITMKAGTDFKVAEGLYTGNNGNTLWDPNQANTNRQYFYKIELINKDYQTGGSSQLVVGPFKFSPRALANASVTQNETRIDYPQGGVNDTNIQNLLNTYLQGTANLVITDFDQKDTLVWGTDYELTVNNGSPKNQIGVNGTIEFTLTGKGCYTGETAKLAVNVGESITNATIREKADADGRLHRSTFSDSVAVLSNKYTDNGLAEADRYGISFLKEDEDTGTAVDNYKTYLYLGESNEGSKDYRLYFNKQYKVDFNNFETSIEKDSNSVEKVYYTISITGINGYYGTAKLKFEVGKKDISSSNINIEVLYPDSYVYRWSDEKGGSVPIPVLLKVTEGMGANAKELTQGVDFDIIYHNTFSANSAPANAGDHLFYLLGKNRYEGRTKDHSYKIQPRSLCVSTVSGGAVVGISEKRDTERFFVTGINETRTYKYLKSGVEPIVGLQYRYKDENEVEHLVDLSENTHFNAYTENGKHVTVSTKEDNKHARIRFEPATENKNFTGIFYEYITIMPAEMNNGESSDCFIRLTPETYDFAAKDITPGSADKPDAPVDTKQLIVGQYIEDGTKVPEDVPEDNVHRESSRTWVEVDRSEYKVEYTGNYYVSGGYTGSNQEEVTQVSITGLYDANAETEEGSGNYRGTMTQSFIIQGKLAERVNGDSGNQISETVITNHIIPYSAIAGNSTDTSGMNVRFNELKRGETEWKPENTVSKDLVWKTDYDVLIEGKDITALEEPVIGEYKDEGTKIREILPTEGKTRYFLGEQTTPIVIQGNLSGAETTVTDNDGNETIVIQIPDGKGPDDLKLQDYIQIICGGKKLVWNEDYIFDNGKGSGDTGTPSMTPGVNKKVTIKPTEKAEKTIGYLTGKKEVFYQVQQELKTSSYTVTGVVPGQSFMYNHGRPVINLDDIKVSIKGSSDTLKKDRDYEIAFKDNDGYTVRDDQAVIITPIGNYAGQPYSIPFVVTKYKLQEGDDLDILAENTAVYTGDNVYPKITSVTVKTISGSGIQTSVRIYGKDDERPEGKEAAFELKPVVEEGNDNINFSNGKEMKYILAGIGNYEGEITLTYKILQKDISADDVIFKELGTYRYQNGDPIKPKPDGTYNGRVLEGVEDEKDGNGDVSHNYSYTYTYMSDVVNASKDNKVIRIRGNWNFKGERELYYKVDPLDLSNTELKFTENEVIYDGSKQQPSFTLIYGKKEILSYSKSGGVKSDYIKDVKVDFTDNTDATKPGHLAKVALSFDAGSNSNYMGTKTAQFVIQPASLEGHVAFMYHPEGEAGNMELKSNLHLPWTGESVKPEFPANIKTDTDLTEKQAGAVYDFAGKHNNGSFLIPAENKDATVGNGDYTIDFKYVEPDSDDTDVKEGYGDAPDCTFAGKIKVTIIGINNYKDSASFWYYIGDDISAEGSAKLQTDKTIYNAQKQPPVVIVNGISRSKYNVERYRGEVKNENYIKSDKEIIDAATYYVRIEGNPSKGTYASKPITLTYIIQPRAISNSVVIDGFKKEYNYTGLAICPIGISVTDYIDRTKYKLTENEDYSLTYTNNINVGTATINVNGEGNFKGTAAARFAITSSMISGGSNGNPGGSVSNGSGQISGAVAVTPDDVRVTLDAGNAMYYTGKQLTPAVTISGMTQNTDYTVTYSNNIEVGTGVITITGMGNNTGTITKNFRIVAKLSDCKVTNIPDQQYTGSAVEPLITVTCGNSILTKDKDYTVSFVNNVEIGTATAMIRAAGNSNYIGSLEAKFNIGNNVGGFIVSGYAPTYPYTGSAITPAVTVESGSTRLQQGTDYTVSYENNVDAGSASIIVKGAGKYTGTQTVNFIIEPRSIQVCETTEVEDKTYTGDAYTPSITVRDSGKVLQNGVDYTLTYSDNVNPGLATITIQGLSNNYTGTKKITFRIGGVAVSGLQVSAVNATSIKLKWQQQGYADGYQVCNSKSKVVKTVNGGNDSTTVAGLKPGKTYKYKVRSYTTNSQGERSYSAASAVVTATTKLKTPAVTLKRKGTGRMRIKWTKSTNADGYEIFYKNTKSAKYRRIKKVDDVNTRICNVRGIKSGKKCYVRVRAYKKTGSTTLRSAMSKTKTIKVK